MFNQQVITWISIAAIAAGGVFFLGRLAERVDALDAWRNSFPDGSSVTEFRMEVPNDGQTDTVEMIPEENGICYLTHIQGGFQGAGERVWIERSAGRWTLNASTLRPQGLIVAANCWEFLSAQ